MTQKKLIKTTKKKEKKEKLKTFTRAEIMEWCQPQAPDNSD